MQLISLELPKRGLENRFLSETPCASDAVRSRRVWKGVTLEVVERTEGFVEELPNDSLRLLVMLDEVGGQAEERLDPCRSACSSYRGSNHLSLLPQGVRAWLRSEKIDYCRYALIHFDPEKLLADVPDDEWRRRTFEPRIMFSDPTLVRLGLLLAAESTDPTSVGHVFGESLAVALFLAMAPSLALPADRTKPFQLAPWQLNRVSQHMEANLSMPLQLDELAKIAQLSVSYFARAFKGSTGLPPHRWHLHLRVKRSQELLMQGEFPLAHIALETGFADQSHFTRVFSRLVGVSPGAWRRSQPR